MTGEQTATMKKRNTDKQTVPVYTAAPTGYLADQYVALYVLPPLQSSLGTLRTPASEINDPKKQADVTENPLPFVACRVPAAASRSPPINTVCYATLDNRVSRR